MKSLFLVRHAKAARDETTLSDAARPLADRGRRDAPKMGRRLRARGVKLNLMLSSPALRALTTARLLAEQLNYEPKRIAVDERLYPGDARQVLEVIRGLDSGVKRVMLVGHNPGLSELACRFDGAITHLATCAVAEFRVDAEAWSDVGKVEFASATLECPEES